MVGLLSFRRLFLLALLALPWKAWAERPSTLEEETEVRERLEALILLVTVIPVQTDFEDLSFSMPRFGMAIKLSETTSASILTSSALTQDRGPISLTPFGQEEEIPARVLSEAKGIATLECLDKSRCDSLRAAKKAKAGACDPKKTLFAIVPAGQGKATLVETRVAQRGGTLPDDLAIVSGLFPEGTPLFDEEGGVAAIVVRKAADGTLRSLVAPLVPPAPKPEEEN